MGKKGSGTQFGHWYSGVQGAIFIIVGNITKIQLLGNLLSKSKRLDSKTDLEVELVNYCHISEIHLCLSIRVKISPRVWVEADSLGRISVSVLRLLLNWIARWKTQRLEKKKEPILR